MRIMSQVIILSAEKSDLPSYENEKRTSNLRKCLEDCNFYFSEAQGFYKGSIETSFVVIVRDSVELEALKSFAFLNFKQESILHQDSNGLSWLIYSDGKEEKLGKLKKVSEVDAKNKNNYTKLNGQYYAIA